MPLHGHRRTESSTSQQETPAPTRQSAASGIFQAAQALGSIGAPAGSLRAATQGTTSAGTDAFFPGSGNTPSMDTGERSAPPPGRALPGTLESTPASAQSEQGAFNSPRRSQTYRQSDELHIPTMGQHGSQQQVPQQSFQPTQGYASAAPGIHLQQAPPGSTPSGTTGGSIPGPLLAGNLQPPGRPQPSSSNTAPTTVPTMQHSPQSSEYAAQQQTTPARSATIHTGSHGYSRSSPAGFENQKYVPFSTTPSGSDKYTPSSSQKYPSYSQQGLPSLNTQGTSTTPLGLADIRPRADTGVSESGAYGFDGTTPVQKNSSYMAPWPVYAYDWCKWPVSQQSNSAGKVAIGSYLEDGHNFIQILDTHMTPQSDVSGPGGSGVSLEFSRLAEAAHSYPVTRILWEPPSSQKQSTDLLATSGDHLRLWSLPASQPSSSSNSITRTSNRNDQPIQKLTPLALLSNSKSPEHTAPLTSLDWNQVSPSLIITSSIDTTCTIWDIPTLTAKTQLIAHDKEVFDVRFCANSVDVFVSCGADGSVRMFDLRSLEHSTIIYEPTGKGDEKGKSHTRVN
jgi:DDB1- and CUL4-associated factor 7